MPHGKINLIDDCGAWGDGSHDDTSAFISARQQLHDAGGGLLEIPTGRFLTDPFTLGPNGGGNLSFTMRGHAAEASKIVLATHNQNGFTFGNGEGSLRRCKVADLSFEYPAFPDMGYAVELRKLNGLIFDNVWVYNFRNGMTIGRDSDGPYGTTLHVTLRDTKFDPGGTVEPGVTLDVRRTSGLTFDNVDLSGRVATTGLRFLNTEIIDTVTAHHLLIKDHACAIRAGFGPVFNLQATNLRLDGISSAALQVELAAGVRMGSWQVRNGWCSSSNYGIILGAYEEGSVLERMDLEIDHHNALQHPVIVYGTVILSKINGVPV